MGAVEVIQHHRHTHITDIELAAVVNSKHQGPFTASAANPRLPGQGLHRQITAEVGDGVEGVDHQGIQPHQGAPRVLVVQVAAVAKVQAATVQVQVFSRYGHRQPSQLRLAKAKAIDSNPLGSFQIQISCSAVLAVSLGVGAHLWNHRGLITG